MYDTLNRVSSEAVKKATGRTWAEWVEALDKEGAREMAHKEIVRLLGDKRYVTNAWWSQMVTVGYETAIARRVAGETTAAGFEVGVRKTFPISLRQAWELITGPSGMQIWLGVSQLRLATGQAYEAANGTRGEIRSITPGRRLRLTWQPGHWDKPSTLQAGIVPSGKNTTISFHHERLAGERERTDMRSHWQRVLEQLHDAIGVKEKGPLAS